MSRLNTDRHTCEVSAIILWKKELAIMKITRNNKNLPFQDCYVVWGDPGYQLTKPDDLGEVSQHLARACLDDDVDDLGDLVSTSALHRLKKVLMAQFGMWRLSVASLSASISVQYICVVCLCSVSV